MENFKLGDIAFKSLDTLDMKTLVNSTMSDRTFVLPSSLPVKEAAKIGGGLEDSLIVCLSDNGKVDGIVSPIHVREEIARIHSMSALSFDETITFMLNSPEERRRGFRHEGNETRTYLYVCDVVPHYVSGNPCPDHKVPTTKRKFGDWL